MSKTKISGFFAASFLLLLFSNFKHTPDIHVEPGSVRADAAKAILASLPDANASSAVAYKDKIVTDFFRRTTGLVAGDGAYSVPLSDGRTLWNFGDAHANAYKNGTVPCLFNVRSIAMVQPANNWNWKQTATLLSPSNSTLYKSHSGQGYFNWPVTGVQLGDTVYTFTLNLRHKSGGWENAGPPQWAKIKFPEMNNSVTYQALQDFGDIQFGDGLVKENDGYVYMYGKRSVPPIGIAHDLFVARFPQSNPNGPWTFWNGSAWVSDVKQAAVIGQVPTFSLHVSKVKNKYLLVSTQFNMGCDPNNKTNPPRDIYAATSNSITGPFSENKLIYRIDDELNGYYPFFYCGIAHPQFINDNRELLITYSINGYQDCVQTCINGRMDPDLTYRPRGVRVPLKLLDPEL